MKTLICGVALCLVSFAVQAEEDPFARDLKIITEWFEGEFDNEEQIWFHRRSRAEGEPHIRLHVAHRRLDLPEFGDHVFYVEEYRNNDPAEVIRQRFVIFSSDLEENAIRMQQGFFRDPKAALGAHMDPGKLSGLKEDDIFFLDECDVFWKRKADQFEGAMKPKTCVFGEGEERRYSVHNLTLSSHKYWRVDTTFLVSDDSLWVGTPVDEPHEMRRSKIFSCLALFSGTPEGVQEPAAQHRIEGMRLHSQGGTIIVTNPVDGEDYQIMMREKEYNFYEDRPDFIYFSLRKPGEMRSLAFAVGDPASRIIGINIGWMSAHCHQEGYTFRQDWAELPKAP